MDIPEDLFVEPPSSQRYRFRGPASSRPKAIVARSVAAQWPHVQRALGPGAQKLSQSLEEARGRKYDRITVGLDDGRWAWFWFDVTALLKSYARPPRPSSRRRSLTHRRSP